LISTYKRGRARSWVSPKGIECAGLKKGGEMGHVTSARFDSGTLGANRTSLEETSYQEGGP